jgi:hypothetical protein
MNILKRILEIDARRIGAMAVALGAATMGLDAAIAHFAGREMKNPGQLIPVLAGALLLGVVPLALPRIRGEVFRVTLRIAAALAAVVGALGTAFHVRAFLRLLEGEAWTFTAIENALAVAPPLAAPGAFIAIGGVFALLASPRLRLELAARPA